MLPKSFHSVLPLLVAVLIAGAHVAEAQPTVFQTTLTLTPPVSNTLGIQSVVYRWTSFAQQGVIGEDDLVDFAMELRAGGTTLYRDEVMVGGVVLPIGGQDRQLDSDLFWDFDLDTLTLVQMRNASFATMEVSSGEQFLVSDSLALPTDSVVQIARYLDGIPSPGGGSEVLLVQRTERLLFDDGFESGDTAAWSSSSP